MPKQLYEPFGPYGQKWRSKAEYEWEKESFVDNLERRGFTRNYALQKWIRVYQNARDRDLASRRENIEGARKQNKSAAIAARKAKHKKLLKTGIIR